MLLNKTGARILASLLRRNQMVVARAEELQLPSAEQFPHIASASVRVYRDKEALSPWWSAKQTPSAQILFLRRRNVPKFTFFPFFAFFPFFPLNSSD